MNLFFVARVRDHYYQPANVPSALSPHFNPPINIGTQATPSNVSRASVPRVSVPREVLLKQELTVDNYVEKFHALLDIEQEEHKVQLAKR